MPVVNARELKYQRAPSVPTSFSSSSSVMNSPERLLIGISTPSRTKRTQAMSGQRTLSASKPRAMAAARLRVTVPWWSSPHT